jgi:hypothetical protein
MQPHPEKSLCSKNNSNRAWTVTCFCSWSNFSMQTNANTAYGSGYVLTALVLAAAGQDHYGDWCH